MTTYGKILKEFMIKISTSLTLIIILNQMQLENITDANQMRCDRWELCNIGGQSISRRPAIPDYLRLSLGDAKVMRRLITALYNIDAILKIQVKA